ncbi:MAG: ATP-binding protein [Myxococcota bacterium]
MCASLRSLERILRRLVQEDIRLDVQTPSRPCWLVIDRTQFEQIVLNLVVNAVDAMPDGGRIEIVVDAGDAERGLSLAVRDTGEGIPDGIKARLFEPFFTTKPRGIGSGLGLSIVQQIVQSVDGSIAVDSILGEGSVFTVRFASAKPPIAQAEALPLRVVRTVSARILVVEDDAWVRQTLKRMLGQDTHELRFARDAPEADALLRAHDVDLLIADIVLPGESGVSLAQRITARDNAPVVLFLTAHLQEMNISVDLPVPWRLLPKPFSVEALLSTIEKLLSYGVSRNDSARTNDRPASARPSGSDR